MWRLILCSTLICVTMGYKNFPQDRPTNDNLPQYNGPGWTTTTYEYALFSHFIKNNEQPKSIDYLGGNPLPVKVHRPQDPASYPPPQMASQYPPSSTDRSILPSYPVYSRATADPSTYNSNNNMYNNMYNNMNNNNNNIYLNSPPTTVASTVPPLITNGVVEPSQNSFHKFSTALFNIIAPLHMHHNVIFSPISLQILLSWLYTAASGRTESELRDALNLPANKQQVKAKFWELLASQRSDDNAKLIMANKMYYNYKLNLESAALSDATSVFDSEYEPIQFADSYVAADNINNWVRRKTENHIQELVTPNTLNAQTQAILLNAIYFKAKWAKAFSTSDTVPQLFYAPGRPPTNVSMMYNDDQYLYGEFNDLKAQALEISYENSNISMLIVLPREREGLAELEQRLREKDLKKLVASMRMGPVTVRLPKFKIDFELDMLESLKQLGIRELFSNKAQLPALFSNQKVRVSGVQHKAYLEVNEAGSEAAAASFAKLIPLSLPSKIIYFTADHPFLFYIRSPEVVYFMGHVVDIMPSQ